MKLGEELNSFDIENKDDSENSSDDVNGTVVKKFDWVNWSEFEKTIDWVISSVAEKISVFVKIFDSVYELLGVNGKEFEKSKLLLNFCESENSCDKVNNSLFVYSIDGANESDWEKYWLLGKVLDKVKRSLVEKSKEIEKKILRVNWFEWEKTLLRVNDIDWVNTILLLNILELEKVWVAPNTFELEKNWLSLNWLEIENVGLSLNLCVKEK